MKGERDVLSRRQRWIGTGVSVAIAIIVGKVVGSLIWTFATFLIATIVVNVVMLKIQDMRQRR